MINARADIKNFGRYVARKMENTEIIAICSERFILNSKSSVAFSDLGIAKVKPEMWSGNTDNDVAII